MLCLLQSIDEMPVSSWCMPTLKTKRFCHMVGTKSVYDYENPLDWSPHDNNDSQALWDLIKSHILGNDSRCVTAKPINVSLRPVWFKPNEQRALQREGAIYRDYVRPFSSQNYSEFIQAINWADVLKNRHKHTSKLVLLETWKVAWRNSHAMSQEQVAIVTKEDGTHTTSSMESANRFVKYVASVYRPDVLSIPQLTQHSHII